MSTRIGINGFGRTGRAMFRSAHEQGADLEWVGINDVMDVEMLAHLLRHDSVYGLFPGTVEVRGSAIVVDGVEIPVSAETDPANLPWTPARADYLPPSMRLATAGSPGGLNGTDINYARAPSLYIHYLGLSPDGLSMLFRVTGAGYGGSDGTAAVVQSTYQLGAGTKDLGKE